ncbi:hypothetical protein KIPB_003075, partial [Kipferlia bialata]|eukprot:g3075.t1
MEQGLIGKLVPESGATVRVLQDSVAEAQSNDLKDLLPHGVAVHNAGMTRSDRHLIERLFAQRHIQILVSTATLAWGVNLPAHTVIIKGTDVYSSEMGGWVDLGFMDVLQMIGRAGRPQFDTSGEGIIITKESAMSYYLSIFNEQLPVESRMIGRLCEALNAEIVLGTVADVREAVIWLRYTYLYSRMMTDSSNAAADRYGVSQSMRVEDKGLVRYRKALIVAAATELAKQGLASFDVATQRLSPLPLGRIAAKFYITPQTANRYSRLLRPDLESPTELLSVFAAADEFAAINLRSEEKGELRRVIERVPIPIAEEDTSPHAKIIALLQVFISRLNLDGFAMVADMVYIVQSAQRLMRALFEIALAKKMAYPTLALLKLSQQCQHRLWEAQTPLRQFKDEVSPDLLRRLDSKNIPWLRYLALSEEHVGDIVREPQQGEYLHNLIHSVPRFELEASVQPVTSSLLAVTVNIEPLFRWQKRFHGFILPVHIMAVSSTGHQVLHSEMLRLTRASCKVAHTVDFLVSLQGSKSSAPPSHVYIHAVADGWLGSHTKVSVMLGDSVTMPSKFPMPSALSDEAPVPVPEDLREVIHKDKRTHAKDKIDVADEVINAYLPPSSLVTVGTETTLSPTMSEAFDAIYMAPNLPSVGYFGPDNATTVLNLALLRHFNSHELERQGDRSTVIYLTASQDAAEARFRSLSVLAEKVAQVTDNATHCAPNVVLLTGDVVADTRLISGSDVVAVCGPREYDVLCRRWQSSKAVRNIGLLLVEDVHLVGAPNGDVLETALSRTRYLSQQLAAAAKENPQADCAVATIRMVVAGVPVANAHDIANWLGIRTKSKDRKKAALFAFPPDKRMQETITNPILPGSLAARLSSLSRAVFKETVIVTKRSKRTKETTNQRALVLVPNMTQGRSLIEDMLELSLSYLSEADRDSSKLYCGWEDAKVDAALSAANVSRDHPELKYLSQGAVTITPATDLSLVEVILELYSLGAFKLLVVPMEDKRLLPSLDTAQCRADIVVIHDARVFDAQEQRFVPLRVADILDIRRRTLAGGRFIIHCDQSRIEYYNRFLFSPLPIESSLAYSVSEFLNEAIANKSVSCLSDALNHLSWTLLYQRLSQNPNYFISLSIYL